MGAQYHAGDIITSGVPAPNSADPRLKQLYDANPYRNAEYTVSPWNQFLSWLGFRTSADAWRENMAIQASEYDSQVAQMDFQNDYNSPASQAERMSLAGMNPNLNGGQSLDSGNSQGMPEDTSLPMVSQGDDAQIGHVVNGCLSAFSTALGLVGSIQGINRNHLSNVMQGIQNESAFADFAQGLSGIFLPESPEPAGMVNGFDWKAQALKNAEKFSGKLPKSMQKKFIDFQSQYWDSAYGQSKSYDDFLNRVNSRRGYYLGSQTNYDEFDDVLKIITDPLAKAAEKIYSSSQKREIAENEAAEAGAQTEKEYQDTLDGALMGEAQNSENKVTKESNESIGVLRESLNEIIQGLEKASHKDGVVGSLASITLAIIAGLQMNFASGFHPSISRSQSAGVDRSTGEYRESSKSTIGF